MAKGRIAAKFEDDPGRSIPLNFDRSCPLPLHALRHWCTGEVLKFHGMTVQECQLRTLNKIEDAVDLVLANLLDAHKISRRCFVGIAGSMSCRDVARSISFWILQEAARRVGHEGDDRYLS